MRIINLIIVLVCLCTGVMAEGNWPTWRGPGLKGMAEDGNPPITFSESKNIKWKLDFPGEGSSTPIVWGKKLIFLTAVPGDDAEKMLSSLDVEPSKRQGIFFAIRNCF